MRCMYCNTPLGESDYCTGCGADISIQKRIGRISNLLYNEGLEKARIRDMEGAITCLKRSLKFNKENTDARNLLGLCYYETGEAVSALCEWVISKNLQGEDNLADYYLDQIQSNKNKLDQINQSIRKYNQSVLYCREDNEDMAIIQLKKVINHNPKLVKAYQLLALLYMKRQEYDRSRRLLRKALQIDATNTTTLRYLQEIENATGKGAGRARLRKKSEKDAEESEVSGTLRYLSGNEMIIQPTTFRDSSTIATFINIILGILLGGAIVWFLIVPANKQAVNDEANRQVTEANAKLATVQVEAEELQEEIDGYLEQVAEAEEDRDAALAKVESYDELLAIAEQYVGGDESGAAEALLNLSSDAYEDNALALYESLSSAVSSSLFTQYYNSGTTAYVQKDYQSAAEDLEKAVEADPDREQSNHYNALLYLGMAYYYLGDRDSADEVFYEIIEYYPSNASVIEGYISSSSSGDITADTLDLSGLGDAATDVTAETDAVTDTGTDTSAASTDTGQSAEDTSSEDVITIYDDDSASSDTSADAVWTDPTTGLQYDANGNVIG
ncbi:MAG: tetratricopeptide repeat protein [Lachnospiraceae bacterium]|nr:tetratricopeptide repeat protein [Lachnospiraceae bacterium]